MAQNLFILVVFIL